MGTYPHYRHDFDLLGYLKKFGAALIEFVLRLMAPGMPFGVEYLSEKSDGPKTYPIVIGRVLGICATPWSALSKNKLRYRETPFDVMPM